MDAFTEAEWGVLEVVARKAKNKWRKAFGAAYGLIVYFGYYGLLWLLFQDGHRSVAAFFMLLSAVSYLVIVAAVEAAKAKAVKYVEHRQALDKYRKCRCSEQRVFDTSPPVPDSGGADEQEGAAQ